jgi:hypothetical protein
MTFGALKRVNPFLIRNARMKNVYAQASGKPWLEISGDNLGGLEGLCGPERHSTGDRVPADHDPST